MAVTGNLAVTNQSQAGFVYLGPDPAANPTSSTVNFPLGDTRTTGVTVALGSGGTLRATFGYAGTTDLVFDVRFLPNPHWVDSLRPLSGRDRPVRDYVLEQTGAEDFVDRTRDLMTVLLPGYQKEGRHYLTVAIGCTGGRHRSVVRLRSRPAATAVSVAR